MPTSVCPECSEKVYVELDCEQGDKVTCEECGAALIVVGLDPVELDPGSDDNGGGSDSSDDFGNYDYDDGGY
jgi:lysine biosynthesis protein LysW